MKVKCNILFVPITYTLLVLLCGTAIPASAKGGQGVKTVVIDPGHGGKDPGTVYGDYKEKDINLKVALSLGDMITKNLPDVKVVYTRKTDVFVALDRRGKIANDAGADLFISLHVNAVNKGQKAPSGAITLVMGQNHADRNLDVAMRENDVVIYEDDYSTKYEGYVPGSVESYIMFSLMQYVNIDQSMALANLMQKHYKDSTPLPDLGARQQPLLVLWQTSMPGVLTEMGFISNATDRKALTSSSGQKKIAVALFNAISEYKSRIEGNSHVVRIDASDGSADTERMSEEAAVAANDDAQVLYRVQICSSPTKLGFNGSLLKKYKSMGVTERRVDGSYKYYVGECGSYSEAVDLQKKVRKTTSDAFVVAFRGDEQIPVGEARKLTK